MSENNELDLIRKIFIKYGVVFRVDVKRGVYIAERTRQRLHYSQIVAPTLEDCCQGVIDHWLTVKTVAIRSDNFQVCVSSLDGEFKLNRALYVCNADTKECVFTALLPSSIDFDDYRRSNPHIEFLRKLPAGYTENIHE